MTPLGKILRSRKTSKVLGSPENPFPPTFTDPQIIDDILADAGLAPFHYPADGKHRKELGSPVPWRFYKFDAQGCRRLMERLKENGEAAGKILNMLAVCDFLIMATWLPDDSMGVDLHEGETFHGTLRHMEHVAASSAAIYGLLLRATEEGFRTYWSSGGILATRPTFAMLGLPDDEVMLGSIFLFPQDVGDASIIPGAWHDKRGTVEDWSRWVEVK